MAKTMRHAFGAALKIAAPPVSLVNRSGLPIARINQPKTSSNDAGCFERGEMKRCWGSDGADGNPNQPKISSNDAGCFERGE
jgi:hypothetical protein